MKISASFKSEVKNCIEELQSGTRKRRPIKLDIDEALDCLFKVIRTGMQWREVSIQSASYCTLFKHAQKWVHSGIFHRAYSTILNRYASHNNGKYYIIDSSHVKNAFGRQGLGRSPVDRGRKGLKISVLTDSNGVVHNIRSDGANISDFQLFVPMLSSMFINLRRIEVFADKGYDSKNNNKKCYDMGFQPRIMRRKCKNSKRQNGKRVHVEHTFAWLDNFRRLRLQYEVSPVVHIAYSLFALGHLISRRYFE